MPDSLRDWADDLRIATAFLTRLPVPWPADAAPDALARALRVSPAVGAAVGLAAGLVYLGAHAVGLPPTLAALLAVAAEILLTGALHEDGLADVADGFGGGRDRAAKLAILRDSRLGSYGAIALVLGLGARTSALAAIAAPGEAVAALVAAGALSRAVLPALLAWLPPARADGLGAGAGHPELPWVATAGALALAVAVIALGWRGPVAVLAASAAAWAIGSLARRQIGGQTGDVLGAAQQVAAIAVLLVAAARP
jgi:adenosylcobinamide-GDP ribazoletransferase